MIRTSDLLEAAKASSHRPLPKSVSGSIHEKMDQILSGAYTVEDVLEMQLDETDETTTAAGVGSGTDRAVGADKDDKFSKLMSSYESYLCKTRMESSAKAVEGFFSEAIGSNYDEELLREFTSHLKEAGFRV